MTLKKKQSATSSTDRFFTTIKYYPFNFEDYSFTLQFYYTIFSTHSKKGHINYYIEFHPTESFDFKFLSEYSTIFKTMDCALKRLIINCKIIQLTQIKEALTL